MYGGGIISWASKKQCSEAHSSTDTEYIAAIEACSEASGSSYYLKALRWMRLQAGTLPHQADGEGGLSSSSTLPFKNACRCSSKPTAMRPIVWLARAAVHGARVQGWRGHATCCNSLIWRWDEELLSSFQAARRPSTAIHLGLPPCASEPPAPSKS